MNNAESIANRYACKNATNNSNTEMNKAIGTDNAPHAADSFKKMIETNAKMIMCPAVMLANKRIIKAKGFVKIPTSSIGIMIGNNAFGTPGVAKMCPQ